MMKKIAAQVKITPFLIFFGILGVIIFVLFINFTFIDNNGGNALGGTIALIVLGLIFMLVALEQSILKARNFRKEYIWLVEVVLLTFLVIYFVQHGISIG